MTTRQEWKRLIEAARQRTPQQKQVDDLWESKNWLFPDELKYRLRYEVRRPEIVTLDEAHG